MTSSSNMLNGNYWLQSYNGNEYRLDVISGVVEKLDRDADTWAVTEDKISGDAADSVESAEDAKYFYGMNVSSNGFYRVNKNTGASYIQDATLGWAEDFAGKAAVGGGDNTLLNYDPLGTGVGTMPITELSGNKQNYHTISGQLYDFFYDSGADAGTVISIKQRTQLSDVVSFTNSPQIDVAGSFSTANAFIEFNAVEGSDKVAILSSDGSDTYFSILDFSSGIPTATSSVDIGANTTVFGISSARLVQLARIDEDHYIIFGQGTSASNNSSIIVEVVAGVPAIVGTKTSLTAAGPMNLRALINIDATTSIAYYRLGTSNTAATFTAILTHDISTGVTTEALTSHGTKHVGRAFFKISSDVMLHVYTVGTTLNAEMFDPAIPANMYNDTVITPISITAQYIKISPKSTDGYVYIFLDTSGYAIKLKIPDTGYVFEILPEIAGETKVADGTSFQRTAESFILPSGVVAMHAYSGGDKVKLMNL